MGKGSNKGIYTGLILILLGITFLLQLRGLLPAQYISIYINLILGIVILIQYFKRKTMTLLLLSGFFLLNGGIILLDHFLIGNNYLAAPTFIIGGLFLIAYMKNKKSWAFIPGVMILAVSLFLLIMTTGTDWDLVTTFSVFLIFVALGFAVVALHEKEKWFVVFSCFLIFVASTLIIGRLGDEAREIYWQGIAIFIILVGVAEVIRSLFFKNHE